MQLLVLYFAWPESGEKVLESGDNSRKMLIVSISINLVTDDSR